MEKSYLAEHEHWGQCQWKAKLQEAKRRAAELCNEWWNKNMAKAEEGKEFDFDDLIRDIEEME